MPLLLHASPSWGHGSGWLIVLVRAFVIGFLSLLLGALLAGSVWLVLRPHAPRALLVSGSTFPITVDTQEQFQRSVSDAIELRSKQLLNSEVILLSEMQKISVSARQLGATVDLEREVERAQAGLAQAHVGPKQNFGVYLHRRLSGTKESFALDLQVDLDEEKTRAVLSRFAERVNRSPRDAQLLIAEHRVLPSVSGKRLYVDATVVRVRTTLKQSTPFVVEPVVESLPPRVSEDELAPVDVTKVLAVYETSFRGKAGPRAVNIRTAGSYLDGSVILPGEVLSFNDVVGRRVHGRGFVDAPVIVNDEMELDVGGGVCQVATTLHAAAVFGNLQVVRRRSHSRPSGYAPLGLDATVIDGKVDLQIQNPYDQPLLVHVSFPERYTIRVELLGKEPDAQVEHAYAVTSREPFARRIWHRPEVVDGGFERKQKGSPGMDVISVLKIVHPDGRLERRRYSSKYYPVPEVFWVSEMGAKTALPDLPEGADGLVVDGEAVEGLAPDGHSEGQNARMEEAVPSYREADRPSEGLRL